MKRKETIYRGLDTISVFFEDTSLNSPDVFQIVEFPTKLTAGKNLIKIRGHRDNLRVGSSLGIEILDFNSDPIYYEIVDYLEQDKSRVIAIYIYEDTSPGEATVNIVGELYTLGSTQVPVEWQGKANVRWTRSVPVNPTQSNISEVIFEVNPLVTIQEQVLTQLDREYTKSQFPVYNSGSVQLYTIGGQPALEIQGGTFISDMKTGLVTISNPVNPKPIATYTPNTQIYKSSVKKVLSDKVLLLDKQFEVLSDASIYPHVYQSFDYSPYGITYEETPTYVTTENSASYAYVEIDGLEPATGDVSRIKIFANNSGTSGTWELINDVELEEVELFIDTGSNFPNFPIGQFTSQSIIDQYWTSHHYDGQSELSAPTMTYDTSSLSNSVYILPSNPGKTTNDNQTLVFEQNDEYVARFISGSNYKLTFDAVGIRDSISAFKDPKLTVYISGSGFNFTPLDVLNTDLPVKLGYKLESIIVSTDRQRFDDYEISFTAPESGTGKLVFALESGFWKLSDIRTTSDNDPGYTPNFYRIRTEVPTNHKSRNQTSFKIEYYNADGVRSNHVSYINNLDWKGGNRYIDGDYSLLTGSLYVADSLQSGVAISGYKDTGFVRSLGYSGFNFGDPGFLLWSGSALSGSSGTKNGVPYSGVGLELYANDNNYFRFSTTDSELDVRTQQFFVGNATTYISASNGNLKIVAGSTLDISNGIISGSAINITTTIQGEPYTVLDTTEKIIDSANVGRVIYSNNTSLDYTSQTAAVNSTGSNVIIDTFYSYILPGETTLTTMYTVSGSRSGGTGIFYYDIIDLYPEYLMSSSAVSINSSRTRIPVSSLNPYVYSGSLTLPTAAAVNPSYGTFFDATENGLTAGNSQLSRYYRYTDISHLAGQYVRFTLKRYPYATGGTGTSIANISLRDITIIASRSGLVKANSAIFEAGGLGS